MSYSEGTTPAWRKSIWYSRGKWLLAQVLMLALNYGQNEVVRLIRLIYVQFCLERWTSTLFPFIASLMVISIHKYIFTSFL